MSIKPSETADCKGTALDAAACSLYEVQPGISWKFPLIMPTAVPGFVSRSFFRFALTESISLRLGFHIDSDGTFQLRPYTKANDPVVLDLELRDPDEKFVAAHYLSRLRDGAVDDTGHRECVFTDWIPRSELSTEVVLYLRLVRRDKLQVSRRVADTADNSPAALAWTCALEGKYSNVKVWFDSRDRWFCGDLLVLCSHSEILRSKYDTLKRSGKPTGVVVKDAKASAASDPLNPLGPSPEDIVLEETPLVCLLALKAMYMGCDAAWKTDTPNPLWHQLAGFEVWVRVYRFSVSHDLPAVRDGAISILCANVNPLTFDCAKGLLAQFPNKALFDAMHAALRTNLQETLLGQVWGNTDDPADATGTDAKWCAQIKSQLQSMRAGDKRKRSETATASASASAASSVASKLTSQHLLNTAAVHWHGGASADAIIDSFCTGAVSETTAAAPVPLEPAKKKPKLP